MSANKVQRMRRRMLTHHLPFLLLSAVGFAALYFTRPYTDVVARASFATAYPALVFLAWTLLIGPWNVLRGRRNPVSTDLRRDVGWWAGGLCLAHSVIGQCVHLRGKPWLYYLEQKRGHLVLRRDVFGFSNYTGLAAALVVIVLLATSNDYFLRRLGTPGWKSLQRWNYAAFVLTAAHALGYQWNQKGSLDFHVTLYVCIALTVVVQTAGFARRKMAKADAVRV
jgi:sulfoxide reductase heme-binding subunit YedZ